MLLNICTKLFDSQKRGNELAVYGNYLFFKHFYNSVSNFLFLGINGQSAALIAFCDMDVGSPTSRRRKRPEPPSETANDQENAVEDRAQKRLKREEKRKRKELRRLRRAARASLPQQDSVSEHKQKQATNEDALSAPKVVDQNVFVWKKKNEQLRKQGILVSTEDELRRKREIEEDLERTKRRRAEREAERVQWEREQIIQAREREQTENADWHRAEESFIGKQHLLRQAIRLREGRGTDVDFLARNMRLDLPDVNADSRSPVELIDERIRKGMTVIEVEQLLESVEREIDCLAEFSVDEDTAVFNHHTRLQWWKCIEDVLKARSRSLRERSMLAGPSNSGVHSSVQADVEKLLKGKTKAELEVLERDLSARIAGENGSKDCSVNAMYGEIDFWAAALRTIRSQRACEELEILTRKFATERQRLRTLLRKESKERRSWHKEENKLSVEDKMMQVEKAKGMRENEELFNEEATVPSVRKEYVSSEAWNDKYRPRKPRYYNRVHTGYDWTKYNRTHYDQNNPPPKTVQGYKFNIFYPDLIDKSITPTFFITKTDNPDVSIITFTAGPPYEDIAFKIVNRPWERSHRKGYRCAFDRGILHLWFHFQRYRYRR